ncbi:helix-turn-helix transcriptional regulator [Parasediminibacterium sp. JCM 36343]|uniref:helix-turn-helix transcriptional regulator n=1 Tax=Parasediminibacterium sp. JCM 36343 TaxID=3374279 RepID=UPI00397AB198
MKQGAPNSLKEYRKKAGYTQQQVARLLGMACYDRICLWEKGLAVPGLMNMLKLCSLFQVAIQQLYPELADEAKEGVESAMLSEPLV